MFEWRDALWTVKPDTLIRWHRKGFRLFRHWKSKPMGRPRLPKNFRRLIRQMAVENATWGRRTYRQRTKAETRDSSVPTQRGKVPASWGDRCALPIQSSVG